MSRIKGRMEKSNTYVIFICIFTFHSDPIVETSTSMGAVLNICNDIAPDYSASKWRTFSVGRE